MKNKIKKHLGKLFGGGLLLIAGWIAVIYVIGIYAHQPGSYYNKGHNAVWIGHEWVGEFKSDKEIQELVNTLNAHEVDTVFVHTGPFEENGSIDPKTYEYSIHFVEKVRQFGPEIKLQAWLGQIRGKIDLSDINVRHNIAKEAMILSQMVGFDGIHFDIEPVWDEDLDFIEVLKESREVMPKEKKISVALAEFIPQSLIWITEGIHTFGNYNTELNYRNVAKYADQIVVMAYETGIDEKWIYQWRISEQVIWLSELLAGKELYIGIPSYEEGQDINPEVENIQNALEGLIKGLNNFRSDESNFAGVAIYPLWEMDEEEWEIYDELWLK